MKSLILWISLLTVTILCALPVLAQIDPVLLKQAESGNVDAQLKLGQMYSNGEGMPKDYNKAAYWLQKAAEQGDMNGQYHLASFILSNKNIIHDPQRGYNLRAVLRNQEIGCYLLQASAIQGLKDAIELYNRVCAK